MCVFPKSKNPNNPDNPNIFILALIGREKGAKTCLYVAVERKPRRIAVELAGRPDENQATAEAIAVMPKAATVRVAPAPHL